MEDEFIYQLQSFAQYQGKLECQATLVLCNLIPVSEYVTLHAGCGIW